MNGRLVPLRYARALYEAAREQNALDAVMRDIAALEEIFRKAPQIKQYCQSPHRERKDELAFIDLAFFPYVGKLTQAMLKLAVENGRLATLPFISMAFAAIADKDSGIVMVSLETAHEVDEDFIRQITARMEKRLSKKVRLEKRIVPEILGGFRLLWQNRILDLSAAGRLKNIRSSLKSAVL